MGLVSRLLFPAPEPSYSAQSFPGELLLVPRSLNPQTSAIEDFVPLLLLRCQGARLLLLVLHGNSEDLGGVRDFCVALRKELNVHVLAPEYPSYGLCPGHECDEHGAAESADRALRFACEVLRWPVDRILVLGQSVGTGPAVSLASKNPLLAGLVLISPFLSIRELCRDSLGPVADFIDERFPNLSRMPAVRSPCLVVHGQRDVTIPARHGAQLFEACRSHKRFVSPLELDHSTSLLQNREYLIDPMIDFFALPQRSNQEPDLHVPAWTAEWLAAASTAAAHARRQQPALAQVALLLAKPLVPKVVWGQRGCHARCKCNGCGGPVCTAYPLVACAGPATCGSFPAAGGTPKQIGFDRGEPRDLVQATMAGAVEHILAVGHEETEWVETAISRPRGDIVEAMLLSPRVTETPRGGEGAMSALDHAQAPLGDAGRMPRRLGTWPPAGGIGAAGVEEEGAPSLALAS